MNNKKKNILLGILVVGVVAMTVAFASLATNLRISGTANTAATSWNIRFEDWEKVAITEVDGHSNTAVSPAANALTKQDGSNVTKVSGVNVVLNQPGDTARYIFKIANRGTIDAKLSNFTVTDTTSNTLVDYEVKCYDNETQDHVPTGTEITTNSVLTANGGIAYCYMQVKYKEQSQPSQTPGNNQVYNQASEVSTNIEATWTWVQAGSASSPATPSTPEPAVSWDNYITPTQASGTTLPANSQFWIQQNTTTKELCGAFPTGTVCMTNNATNFGGDFAGVTEGTYTLANITQSGLQGDTLTKAQAMLTAGATSCSINSNIMYCQSSDMNCSINDSGTVGCNTLDFSHYCEISYGDSAGCE